jgi:hypothetical protein
MSRPLPVQTMLRRGALCTGSLVVLLGLAGLGPWSAQARGAATGPVAKRLARAGRRSRQAADAAVPDAPLLFPAIPYNSGGQLAAASLLDLARSVFSSATAMEPFRQLPATIQAAVR